MTMKKRKRLKGKRLSADERALSEMAKELIARELVIDFLRGMGSPVDKKRYNIKRKTSTRPYRKHRHNLA